MLRNSCGGHCRKPGFHPVVRLNEANLLEMLSSQYTLWNHRGIDGGLESVDESGVVRFPTGPTVSPAQRLEELVGQLKTHYGAHPVILVDEYDAPLVFCPGNSQA